MIQDPSKPQTSTVSRQQDGAINVSYILRVQISPFAYKTMTNEAGSIHKRGKNAFHFYRKPKYLIDFEISRVRCLNCCWFCRCFFLLQRVKHGMTKKKRQY